MTLYRSGVCVAICRSPYNQLLLATLKSLPGSESSSRTKAHTATPDAGTAKAPCFFNCRSMVTRPRRPPTAATSLREICTAWAASSRGTTAPSIMAKYAPTSCGGGRTTCSQHRPDEPSANQHQEGLREDDCEHGHCEHEQIQARREQGTGRQKAVVSMLPFRSTWRVWRVRGSIEGSTRTVGLVGHIM